MHICVARYNSKKISERTYTNLLFVFSFLFFFLKSEKRVHLGTEVDLIFGDGSPLRPQQNKVPLAAIMNYDESKEGVSSANKDLFSKVVKVFTGPKSFFNGNAILPIMNIWDVRKASAMITFDEFESKDQNGR